MFNIKQKSKKICIFYHIDYNDLRNKNDQSIFSILVQRANISLC